MVRNISCSTCLISVPILYTVFFILLPLSIYVSLTPNPDQFMRLLLTLVAIPNMNK